MSWVFPCQHALNLLLQAVLYVLLTWKDPRAYAAIENATWQAINNASNYNGGNGCEVCR